MLPYEDEKLAPRQRALDLLSRMTLREKVGQLTQRLYGFRVYERHGPKIMATASAKGISRTLIK